MTRRKRTGTIVVLAVTALLVIAGVAYAAGVFPDVSATDTHFSAIEWAAANGVVNGYTNGNFGPYDNILRGQAATMFKNYDTYLRGSLPAGGGGVDGCTDCHDDTALITSKVMQFENSVHGVGFTVFDHWEDGVVEASCAGCHSGTAFSEMVAAGMSPNEVTEDDVNPTKQDCRACHQIHVTGTGVDWALETEEPVTFYALPTVTFDGGAGNLCATCHQPRVAFPAAVAGMVTITSSRFGPHHGPQSATLAGAGLATIGDPSPHMGVPDTCITCHMGPNDNHVFEANVERCQTCHAGAPDFNINGVQTTVTNLLAELKPLLVAAGMLNNTTEAAIPGVYPEAQAAALWNYRDIKLEDKSLGVHNPDYVIGALEAGIAAMTPAP